MSAKPALGAQCADEEFLALIKSREAHGQDFVTRAEAKHCVFGYIEGWYNTTRMHSSLGYRSPIQFELDCRARSINAANDDVSTASSNDSQFARLTKSAA